MKNRLVTYPDKNSIPDLLVGILLASSIFLVYLKYFSNSGSLSYLLSSAGSTELCTAMPIELIEVLVYSHIPLAATMMVVAIFVYLNNRQNHLSRTALTTANIFTFWVFANLGSWLLYQYPGFYVFARSQLDLLTIIFLAYLLIFSYEYLNKKELHWKRKVLLLLPIVPVALYLTSEMIAYYDITSCAIWTTKLYEVSTFTLKVLYIASTVLYLVWKYLHSRTSRLEVPIVGIALLMCTYSFIVADVLYGATSDLRYHIYGLLPLVGFVTLFTVLIVRYTAFRISITGANVIIIALVSFVAIKIFFFTTYADLAIDISSTFLAIAFSYMLLQNIKREHAQKEQIESLASELTKANEKLKVLDKLKSEFVSIASHQLRAPLTAIRGYTELMLDGSYGKVNKKMKEVLGKVSDSSYNMAVSIEDYLNVSRIEAGNMRYQMTDFNLKDLAEQTVDGLRREAVKKGLLLTFQSDLRSRGIVNADKGKVKQVLDNLIDNALKYTKKGSVTVSVRESEKPKKIYVDVIDTGIGIEPKMLEEIFKKFERAKNASGENLEGTGLGLYIAQKIAKDMNGAVYASSDGENTGSTFTLELPLMM